MSVDKRPSKAEEPTQSEISRELGAKYLLPGESAERYNQGLVATIDELGAKTPLQTYIAEKIFQCLWWIRRYEAHKHASITMAMVEAIVGFAAKAEIKHSMTRVIEAGVWDDPDLQQMLATKGYTSTSLLELVMSKRREHIAKLDQQVALRVKMLAQLQQAYEGLVNRSILHERIALQNEILRRDLGAIDVQAVEPPSKAQGKPHDKRQAKSR